MRTVEYIRTILRERERAGRVPVEVLPHLKGHFLRLADMLEEAGLPVSVEYARNAAEGLDTPSQNISSESAQQVMEEVAHAIENECATIVFFSVEARKRPYFDNYNAGWEPVVARFRDTATDIEEMGKCYALGRYAASVFHAVRANEAVLIGLGKLIGDRDPTPGWSSVTNTLKDVLDKKFPNRTPFEQEHTQFFEQVYATVVTLKNAWRNKVSHAHGTLALMTVEFSPEIAEEIIVATRAFCRRVASEMPERST
jgi:hypothetical protein